MLLFIAFVIKSFIMSIKINGKIVSLTGKLYKKIKYKNALIKMYYKCGDGCCLHGSIIIDGIKIGINEYNADHYYSTDNSKSYFIKIITNLVKHYNRRVTVAPKNEVGAIARKLNILEAFFNSL